MSGSRDRYNKAKEQIRSKSPSPSRSRPARTSAPDTVGTQSENTATTTMQPPQGSPPPGIDASELNIRFNNIEYRVQGVERAITDQNEQFNTIVPSVTDAMDAKINDRMEELLSTPC